MFFLGWAGSKQGESSVITVALVGMLQGSSIVGLLPFVIQQSVYTSEPATANVVAGLVTTLGMAIAAPLNQLFASIPGMSGISLVLIVSSFQFCVYALHGMCIL